MATHGLSPRLRGNLAGAGCHDTRERSIPAPAGEPAADGAGLGALWVYPRACGGTARQRIVGDAPLGLSPRLRGNQHPYPSPARGYRSIPAPAGEPGNPTPARLRSAVYPRACGGTKDGGPIEVSHAGLSPRLRGNHHRKVRSEKSLRSIPAPAGEPPIRSTSEGPLGVYPRACGGTSTMLMLFVNRAGLSPRLRGNHQTIVTASYQFRSIPAPAGEPSAFTGLKGDIWVYPRACGGTAF